MVVHIVPVNSDTATYKPPVRSLLGCGTEKPREPGQWRGDAATIHKRDNQFVVGALNIDSVRHRFTGQSAHPTQ